MKRRRRSGLDTQWFATHTSLRRLPWKKNRFGLGWFYKNGRPVRLRKLNRLIFLKHNRREKRVLSNAWSIRDRLKNERERERDGMGVIKRIKLSPKSKLVFVFSLFLYRSRLVISVLISFCKSWIRIKSLMAILLMLIRSFLFSFAWNRSHSRSSSRYISVCFRVSKIVQIHWNQTMYASLCYGFV